MAERKIIVPEGMLKAADEAIGLARREKSERSATPNGESELWPNDIKRLSIESALRWLSDHLPLPSINDDAYSGPEWATGWNCGIESVRRIFLAPETSPVVAAACRAIQGCTLSQDDADSIIEAILTSVHGYQGKYRKDKV